MDNIPAFHCRPTQGEIDAKMRVLNETIRRLGTAQASDVKDQAMKALNESYNWLAMHGIDFYYDIGTESFRV